MKRGVNGFASIAATEPFVGFFGTVLGIIRSFSGSSTERTTLMLWTLRYLSDALVPTALGLVVAVLAFCFYRYLSARLEDFDIEMTNVSLQLMDELAHF